MTNPLTSLKAVEMNEAASNVNWYELAGDVGQCAEPQDESTKITVRAAGKCHPARDMGRYGFVISCSCPGSQNGRLESACRKVSDGWEMANCGN